MHDYKSKCASNYYNVLRAFIDVHDQIEFIIVYDEIEFIG